MIGTLKESSLHAALKQIYKEPGDKVESSIGKYIVDIVREELLIEIQIKNFSKIRRKLEELLKNNQVLLIYPIIKDKWIIKLQQTGNRINQKRLSPQHGSFLNIFKELIYIPHLLSHFNLTIEILLIQAEEIQVRDNKGSWRRKGWSVYDRRLLKVLDWKMFSTPEQLLQLIPMELKNPFTNHMLADSLNIKVRLAQMITYTLRKMNMLTITGKKGNSHLYSTN
ncbi:MAG: hypothetical protein ACFE9P_01440 [Candidatus Hermodarchaeota archaeon]